MANNTIRFLLGIATCLPMSAIAQAQIPLTGGMATSVPTVTRVGSDAAVMPSEPNLSSAVTRRRDFAATWAVEVPMSGQAPNARTRAATSAAATSTQTDRTVPSSYRQSRSSAQTYPVAANAPATDAASTNGSSPNGSYTGSAPPPSSYMHPHRVGDDTATLLAQQANGTHAGNQPGMLGAAASLSYQRYLNSFKQPIPEWFKEAVKKNGSGG